MIRLRIDPVLDILLRKHYGIQASIRGALNDSIHISLYSDAQYVKNADRGISGSCLLVQTGSSEYKSLDYILKEFGLEIDICGLQIEPLDFTGQSAISDLGIMVVKSDKVRARIDARLKNSPDATASLYRQIQKLTPGILNMHGISTFDVTITGNNLVLHSEYLKIQGVLEEIARYINQFFGATIVIKGSAFKDCAAFDLERSLCWML